MRTYGTVGDIEYTAEGWCIYHHQYKYRVNFDDGSKPVFVYADNMRELKKLISEIDRG